MENIAVIYWSGSGNTEIMAKEIAKGVEETGNTADLIFCTDFAPENLDAYRKIMLGCPSMGEEVLEEDEFEPFFSKIEGKITGKSIALFGSYGWGDGEWMRDWENRVKNAGAVLYHSGLIIEETPDREGEEQCQSFGKSFALN